MNRSFRSAQVSRAALALLAGLFGAPGVALAAEPTAAPQHFRVVGGLAGVNQFTRHEEPFWLKELPRVSEGRLTADIVAYDRAGVRGQDMLRLVQLGAIAFGTVGLALSSQDAELLAPDLAGLNLDVASVQRNATAFRPPLTRILRERYGIELLALYIYPAQVTFCKKPIAGLADLVGRRVRVANVSQSDFMLALGAIPVQTGFAEIGSNLKSGAIDCAVTGTMSGNSVGLPNLTAFLHTMPVSWGLTAFVANGATWNALAAADQSLLRRELAALERSIWAESEQQTGEGIACNVGSLACRDGRKGAMKEVRASAADDRLRRDIFTNKVLPGWLERCGASCVDLWKNTILQPAPARP